VRTLKFDVKVQFSSERRLLTQSVEYALRAVVYLAREGEPRTTAQVAEATQVPAAYLSKVLQGLSRAGIVKSQRGIGGGMTLLPQPADLTILDVVNAVDPLQRIETCPLGLLEHGVKLCALHRRLDNAMRSVEDAFRKSTLADVLADPNPSIPLGNATSSAK
jgi:Rrf2 family transcriptional regulator, nitric oxide-sensitive transcriptional repressor